MNHSTKWNRVTVNKPLLHSIRFVKESLYLNGLKPSHNVATGISHTCQPDGSVVKR